MKSAFSWSFLSTASSSVGNFLLLLVVLRTQSDSSFGIFALGFAGYALLLNVNRAFTGSLLIIRFSASSRSEQYNATASASLVSILIGLFGGLILIACGAYGFGSWSMVWIGFSMPAAMALDTLRYGYFTRGTPRSAAMVDMGWTGFSALGFLLLSASSLMSAGAAISIWGGSALAIDVIAGYGLLQACANVPWRRAFQEGWGDRIPLALEMGALASTDLLTLAAISIVSTTAITGVYRASALVQAPFTVALSSAIVVLVPALIRRLKAETEISILRPLVLFAAACSALAVCVSLSVYALPQTVGFKLFSSKWPIVSQFAILWSVPMLFSAISAGAFCGLRALVELRAATTLRITVLPLYFLAVYLGVSQAGVSGAIVGYAISTFMLATASWLVIIVVLRRRAHDSSNPSPVEGVIE